MAKNFGRVNVSITASTGGLTAGLGRASKQLGGFAGQAQGIGGRLTTLAAGFVGAGRGATVAAVGVKALGLAIKTLLGPLLVVTSLVSIFSAFGRSARELDEAGKTARRLGMSMTSFQNLGQVAEEAGVSMGQMGTLLTFMSRNLGNLANGSTSAQKAFGRLGLSMTDLAGLSPERQFELISQRIMALPTAAERTAAAMAIFGRQGAMAMGLIADASSGAISEVAKLREQLGLNLTDTQVKGIEMMNDAIGRMSLVFHQPVFGPACPGNHDRGQSVCQVFCPEHKRLDDSAVAGGRLCTAAATSCRRGHRNLWGISDSVVVRWRVYPRCH